MDGLARVRLVELAEHRAALAPLHEHEFLRRVPFLPLDQPAAGASSGSPLIGRHRLSPAGGLAAFVEWREETAVRKGRGGPRPINPETPLEGSSPADLAWLAGTWRARIGENEIEERWSEFGEGTLMAMFRWVRDGQVLFYEIEVLEQEGASICASSSLFNISSCTRGSLELGGDRGSDRRRVEASKAHAPISARAESRRDAKSPPGPTRVRRRGPS